MMYLLAATAALLFGANATTQTCTPRPGPIDVYFLLDGSTSIGEDMWQNKLFFISTLISEALTHPDDRAGVVQWSNKPPVQHFTFDDPLERQAFEIMQINQLYGSTKTDSAVHKGMNWFEADTPPPSPRPQVILLVTDGEPNPPKHNPCLEGNAFNLPPRIREKEANEDFTFAIIGIGRDPDFSKLNCLVADPTVNSVVIRDFTSFDDYRDPTGGLLCVDDPTVFETPTPAPTIPPPSDLPTPMPTNVVTADPTTRNPSPAPTALPTTRDPSPQPSPMPTSRNPTPMPTNPETSLPTPMPTTCEPRLEPIDVYFLVDGSSSIEPWQWNNLQMFLSTITQEALDVPGDRVGLVQWSNKKPRWEYSFDDTLEFFKDDVYNMEQMMGATKTDWSMNYGLRYLRNDNEENPPEPENKKQLMVVITDGEPNPPKYGPCHPTSLEKYDLPLKLALQENLEVVVIGIGRDLDFKNIFECVVEDKDENIIRINDFTSFDDYRDPSGGLLCVEDPNVFATPTPAPIMRMETAAPTEVGECDGGDTSPVADLLAEYKKCLDQRSESKCNKKKTCNWVDGICGLKEGADLVPEPSECKAMHCEQYQWFGGEEQCTWKGDDGCGCALFGDRDSCNKDGTCNWGDDCKCHAQDVCEGLEFDECRKRSKRCSVCGDQCVPKCQLGPGQEGIAGLQAVLDHDTCKCKIQTVEGTCGCKD